MVRSQAHWRLFGVAMLAARALLPTNLFAAESPAFQGHAAEVRAREPMAEQLHRALFFDSVDVEIGTPGLPCDHLKSSKPQVIAGVGHVVLLTTKAGPVMRVWFPPGSALSAGDARTKAQAVLAERLPGADQLTFQQREFFWCR
jgi:hypothetical protein